MGEPLNAVRWLAVAVIAIGAGLAAFKALRPDSALISYVARLTELAIGRLGYAGVAGLMALESAAVPVPSEVIVPLAAVHFRSPQGLISVVLASTAGNLLGSAALYFIAREGGRGLLYRYSSTLGIGREELRRAEEFFATRGGLAVVVGRLLPAVRTYISAPPGLFRMAIARFLAYTLAGSVAWNSLLAWLGYSFGYAIISSPWLDYAGAAGLVALGLVMLFRA
jgi:membrane protein DedA with SNARE-associated domain